MVIIVNIQGWETTTGRCRQKIDIYFREYYDRKKQSKYKQKWEIVLFYIR